MRRRSAAFFGVFLLLPASLLAQAWVPPKGELFFSVSYQWLKADKHLLSSDVLGPELTPIEELYGVDFDSVAQDFGKIDSQAVVLDADIAVTDKLALSGGLAFVQGRWRGVPADADSAWDDGTYHGHFQDARIGARYAALNGSWMLTPSADFVFPLTDYPIMGHSVIGRGLKELQLGVNVGRILNLGGIPRAYVQGRYAYAIIEDVETVSLDRSNLQLELGYFHRAMTFQVFGSWQKVHGGIDWAQHISPHASDLAAVVGVHDQAAQTRDFELGGAVTFHISDAADLLVALNNTLWGANTHSARTVTFGITYGFRAFGGIGPTRGPRDDHDDE